jgi:hypothetical protein
MKMAAAPPESTAADLSHARRLVRVGAGEWALSIIIY